jgi:hypothetical protein
MAPGFSSLNGMLYVYGGQTVAGEFTRFQAMQKGLGGFLSEQQSLVIQLAT